MEEVQTETSQPLLDLDVDLEQLAGEDEIAHPDEHDPRTDLNRSVVALEQRERARRGMKATAAKRNGNANPAEYTPSSSAPFVVPAVVAANPRIAPSVGPMHGVQASANAAPATAGPRDRLARSTGRTPLPVQ